MSRLLDLKTGAAPWGAALVRLRVESRTGRRVVSCMMTVILWVISRKCRSIDSWKVKVKMNLKDEG
jgi:hypothetical protein